jgi:hypothetical protein
MSNVTPRGTDNRPAAVRPAFLAALLVCLGAALVALQTIQPVREGLGLDPVVRSVARTAAVSRLAAEIPTSVRPLGTGTRRALRLPPTAVQVVAHTQPRQYQTTARLAEEGRELDSRHLDGLTATVLASDLPVRHKDPSVARLSIDADATALDAGAGN